jgi:hypothetical protein
MFEFSPVATNELEKLNRGVSEKIVNSYVTVEALERQCKGNKELEDLLQQTLEQCARYAESIFEFSQVVMRGTELRENGEFQAADLSRKRVHDSTIDSINIFARQLKKAGRDSSWIAKLSPMGRAAYTKFTLLVAYELMVRG